MLILPPCWHSFLSQNDSHSVPADACVTEIWSSEKMQMSYCWNAEWTKCQSILSIKRYEIDVDRLFKASVIAAAEGRLYQQLWYLSCEISLVLFCFFQRNKQFSYVLCRDYPENTPTVCLLSSSWIFSKTNDNKEQYRRQVVAYCFQLLMGIF